ncbi:hypothetical protein [Streptacidiphilus fuscans]|uniref:Uncharacterized protein n=1 Tax=Streptacidiphilus fuscans TaxID=2789292 RepID=A0A931B982_9ACTN|nr:hypothetical protein [Streptacidiphilus fuscans]MBF9071356.1 hypothetical protein [Streptacidiphilus fuscans]
MTESYVDLGAVAAPSGVLVLGMAAWVDFWPETGRSLSERAFAAVESGGAHLYEPADGEPRPWSGEAIVVRAAVHQPLQIRALTSPSPFDGEPTISVLEVDLGLPWPEDRGAGPLVLGDLPVDRCGMVLGDARALDGFSGLDRESIDGLADVTYWGKYEGDVHAEFGGERVPRHHGGYGPRGWLDLPLPQAEALAEKLRTWLRDGPGKGLMIAVNAHTDYHRLNRAGWSHPLLSGVAEVGGCPVLGIGWDPGDHSMRHRGERAYGQVYPATLESLAGRTVLRWTIPPYSPDPDDGPAS